MSAREDGGPAFPTSATDSTDDGTFVIHRGGMTLRDYFAAAALQGLISANGDEAGVLEYDEKIVAKSAYELADAMLAERAK